jgi:hypothetical protein
VRLEGGQIYFAAAATCSVYFTIFRLSQRLGSQYFTRYCADTGNNGRNSTTNHFRIGTDPHFVHFPDEHPNA